jgi:hypothetical protein
MSRSAENYGAGHQQGFSAPADGQHGRVIGRRRRSGVPSQPANPMLKMATLLIVGGAAIGSSIAREASPPRYVTKPPTTTSAPISAPSLRESPQLPIHFLMFRLRPSRNQQPFRGSRQGIRADEGGFNDGALGLVTSAPGSIRPGPAIVLIVRGSGHSHLTDADARFRCPSRSHPLGVYGHCIRHSM